MYTYTQMPHMHSASSWTRIHMYTTSGNKITSHHKYFCAKKLKAQNFSLQIYKQIPILTRPDITHVQFEAVYFELGFFEKFLC